MKSRMTLARLSLCVLSGSTPAAVLAQLIDANPYYIGIGQAFTYENNLFRVADGTAKTSETYSTTSLLAGLDQPIGRQRLYADAVVRHNRYRDIDTLNHTGYSLDAGIDWESVNRLSGRLGYTGNERLARFGIDRNDPLIVSEPNEERTQELLARVKFGGESVLAIEGSVMRRNLDYSASDIASPFALREFEQDTAGVGVQYRPGGLTLLGAAIRVTRGEYPAVADEFDRMDFDLTAVYTPSGLSKLRARLSYTDEEHDRAFARDLKGVTGALGWEYKPTGKLGFFIELLRDSGAEATFSSSGDGLQTATATGTTSRVTNLASLRALYEATAKIQLEVNLRYAERDLIDTTVAGGGAATDSGTDRTTEFALGARYAATRNLLFACSIGTERRRASSNSLLSYPYSAGRASCSAQFVLQ